MTRSLHGLTMIALLFFVPGALADGGQRGGIGVMGDSYSDEYEFYPPDRSTARNWVEILARTRGVDFGPYSTASRGEPRNQGYAYNWARSDATTASLIATGQHTGVARQVARGEVSIVAIFIGGNDFINAFRSADPGRALDATLPAAMANYRTALQTVLDASPNVQVVLFTLPDIRDLPEFAGPIRRGTIPVALADRYTAAMREYNAQIRSIGAREPRATLIDLDLVARAANVLSRDYVPVAGRRLDRHEPSNQLDHFFLADVRHPGTLGQALVARTFLQVLNVRFGYTIRPLGDQELLAFAEGIPSAARRDGALELARFRPTSPGVPPSDPVVPRGPSERP